METGEITVAEYSRLHPLASERELRFAQITHELNIGGLFALAYADAYPAKGDPHSAGEAEDTLGSDAELLQLGREFEAARQREIAAVAACNAEPFEESRLEARANDAGDAVAGITHRIAGLPAHTAAGFRVKLRALSQYRRDMLLADLPHLPDPDQVLSHSLWHDVQQETPAPAEPHALLSGVAFGPDRAIAETAAEFCRIYRLHGAADRAMLAGSITEDQWKPHHDAITGAGRACRDRSCAHALGRARQHHHRRWYRAPRLGRCALMPTMLPTRPAPERRLSPRDTVRFLGLIVRVRWLDRRLHAAHRRDDRLGLDAAGPQLLALAYRWLDVHQQIGALLGLPEPPPVAQVRATLRPLAWVASTPAGTARPPAPDRPSQG